MSTRGRSLSCLVLIVASAVTHSFAGPRDDTTVAEALDEIQRIEPIAGTFVGAPQDSATRARVSHQLADVIQRLQPLASSSEHGYTAAFLMARAHYMEYNLDVPGSFEATVEAAELALKHEPDRHEPYDLLGAFYANSGRAQDAVDCYWKSISRRDPAAPLPAHLMAGLSQAYIYSANGLWASHAARAAGDVQGSDSTVVNGLTRVARTMADEDLLEAVTIDFAPDGIRYRDRVLGFETTIPPEWRIDRESHQTDEDAVRSSVLLMGMPAIVGERGEGIENAVALLVYSVDEPRSEDQQAREKCSSLIAQFPRSRTWDDRFTYYEAEKDGVTYAGLLACAIVGRSLHIVQFTATPQTFEGNLERFLAWYAGTRFFEE